MPKNPFTSKNIARKSLRVNKSNQGGNPILRKLFTFIVSIIILCAVSTAVSRRGFHISKFGSARISLEKSSSSISRSMYTNPMVAQPYQLLQKTKLSPDSYLLQYAIEGRSILGKDPKIPTCIKVDYEDDTDAKTGERKKLSKSYSPVSHPQATGIFDLVVKSYPLEPGGGVGKYLCDMNVGESITATLKKERIMHGSPVVEGRWKHVGLVAGGTGIAPLLQIARILLDSPRDTDTKIHLLFINRNEEDILGKSVIDQMVKDHPDNFFVTYSLTGIESHDQYETGRGTVDMVKKALPPPTDTVKGEESDTMIFVCGKDGFVDYWGGPVVRGPPKPDGSKGPKIQGPLQGVLLEAGYNAEQVFKY